MRLKLSRVCVKCGQILGSVVDRQALGHEAVLLLTLLIQYRKYEVSSSKVQFALCSGLVLTDDD